MRAYRLHVYATLSGATLTDLNLTAPSPRSLGVSLPQDHIFQLAEVAHHGPVFGAELSAVTLFFVQHYRVTRDPQMYLIIGTVETIATKPETVTFPSVLSAKLGRGVTELIYGHSLKLH